MGEQRVDGASQAVGGGRGSGWKTSLLMGNAWLESDKGQLVSSLMRGMAEGEMRARLCRGAGGAAYEFGR